MCIEELTENQGLERFLKIAMKYYETKYGTPQTNLREKAMAQWLDLQSYKEKMKVLEFMQSKIHKIEKSQPKITNFFKPVKIRYVEIPEFDNEITKEYTAQKTAVKQDELLKSPYHKFYEETYWKIKLENENLNVNEIRKMVQKQWESHHK